MKIINKISRHPDHKSASKSIKTNQNCSFQTNLELSKITAKRGVRDFYIIDEDEVNDNDDCAVEDSLDEKK